VGSVPDAAALLGAFDVLVLSSRTEGTPIVLLEGMSAGRAIIATAVGGIPDAVGDGAAMLVPPESAADLTRAIVGLLADPERRESLATAARARAASFTIPAWVARHREVYQTALDRAGSA
jgi:glycosyltransferase involved in cell wall biosynthesis